MDSCCCGANCCDVCESTGPLLSRVESAAAGPLTWLEFIDMTGLRVLVCSEGETLDAAAVVGAIRARSLRLLCFGLFPRSCWESGFWLEATLCSCTPANTLLLPMLQLCRLPCWCGAESD